MIRLTPGIGWPRAPGPVRCGWPCACAGPGGAAAAPRAASAVRVTTAPVTPGSALIAASALARIASIVRAAAGSMTMARKTLPSRMVRPETAPESGRGVRPSGPGTPASAAITSSRDAMGPYPAFSAYRPRASRRARPLSRTGESRLAPTGLFQALKPENLSLRYRGRFPGRPRRSSWSGHRVLVKPGAPLSAPAAHPSISFGNLHRLRFAPAACKKPAISFQILQFLTRT